MAEDTDIKNVADNPTNKNTKVIYLNLTRKWLSYRRGRLFEKILKFLIIKAGLKSGILKDYPLKPLL